MKISSKLIITTATGVIGLIAVAIISYHQITQIHKSTVNFADFIYPSVSTLDGIRNDVAEMKAITLQMIVDEGDDATFGTLVKEFERAKSDMLVLIKKYRDRLVRNETDQALLDSVEATAKIALDNLNLVARVVHKHDITTATEFWYTIDENLDSLSSAIKKLRNYNDSFVEKSYIEANIAYDSSLMLSLITSGIIALLMSVMTIWSYKSLIDPLKTLEIKLDEISHSFNLQKRLEINSTDELQVATNSINRLLERAHVGMVDMNEKHDKANYVAHHDHLTGLPNRTLFSDRLQQALAIAKRDKGNFAIMFIDLDKFKPVNDVFGHHIGDLLLKEAAERMLECIRESDTVARLGGDEFVVLLPFIENEQDALLVAEKIRHILNQPFALLGNQMSISSSTGIVVYPEHGSNEAELTKNADVAMYHVKESGRNAVMLFNTNMRK